MYGKLNSAVMHSIADLATRLPVFNYKDEPC